MARSRIDWNRWHKLVTESVLAFRADAVIAICDACRIRHMSFMDDPRYHEHVTADTLNRALFAAAEYLLKWALSGVENPPEKDRLSDWNCYRDDAGTPTLAINLCHDETPGEEDYQADPLNAIFSPEIQLKLYVGKTKEKDNLVICFIPASQDY